MDFTDLFRLISQEKVARGDVESEMDDLREQAERLLKALGLLTELRESWHQQDPGKGRPYVFFVRDFRLDPSGSGLPVIEWCDAFFAQEFVHDLSLAREGIGNFWAGPHADRTPVPLGRLEEARVMPCHGLCGRQAYVIGRYAQTYDSPSGDCWDLELFSFCPYCLHVSRIGRRESDYRFVDLLKQPAER